MKRGINPHSDRGAQRKGQTTAQLERALTTAQFRSIAAGASTFAVTAPHASPTPPSSPRLSPAARARALPTSSPAPENSRSPSPQFPLLGASPSAQVRELVAAEQKHPQVESFAANDLEAARAARNIKATQHIQRQQASMPVDDLLAEAQGKRLETGAATFRQHGILSPSFFGRTIAAARKDSSPTPFTSPTLKPVAEQTSFRPFDLQ